MANSTEKKNRLKTTVIWFYKSMMRITWTLLIRTVKTARKRPLMLNIRKRGLNFLELRRKDDFENLIFSRQFDDERATRYLANLREWTVSAG